MAISPGIKVKVYRVHNKPKTKNIFLIFLKIFNHYIYEYKIIEERIEISLKKDGLSV